MVAKRKGRLPRCRRYGPPKRGLLGDEPRLSNRNQCRTALGPKLVLLDLQSELTLIVPGDSSPRYEVQKALLIELRWPTDRNFQASTDRQVMVRCK
jgi:hypothetical protein